MYAVGMLSPATGDVGDSAATFSGGIALDPALPTQAGKAVVTAATPTVAISAALLNTVVATFGGQSAGYSPEPGTVSNSTSAHLPFVVTTTNTPGQYLLLLEDLANMPGLPPDWDYNDRSWTVVVTELTAVTASPPSPAEESADGSRPAVVTLTRSNSTPGSLDQPLYLPFTLSGTATPGIDYVLPSSQVAVFWPGEATTTVVLPVTPDTDAEGSETVTLTFAPQEGTAPTPFDTTVTITDPGTLPTVPPEPPPASPREVWVSGAMDGEERPDGLRPVVFHLSRTNPNAPDEARPLTVYFSLSGTASTGSDYTTPSAYTATFAPGQLTLTLTLNVVYDEWNEGMESVLLTLIPGDKYTVRNGEGSREADIADYGEMPPQGRGSATVSGTVWYDRLRNDLQDPFIYAGDAPMARVRVTLLDATGTVFTNAFTDADGVYTFTRVPFGTYRVKVFLWGMEQFVNTNVGGSPNESIDSDVNIDGVTDEFELTATNPSADQDAGAFLADPPQVDDKSVHIMLPLNKPTTKLKVAKWASGVSANKTDAFEAGANNVPKLKGVEKEGFDFIDRDEDRFNVYVRDTTIQNRNWVDVTIGTKMPGAQGAIHDDMTSIRLVRYATDPNSQWYHWFWSDSQLLVSNQADDKYERAVTVQPGNGNKPGGGIGEDDKDTPVNQANEPLTNNEKNTYVFPVGDRTHRVALGEVVKAVYLGTETEAEVAVRKKLNVRIRILVDPNLPAQNPENDGTRGQVVKKADVEVQVSRMKELFAQLGIEVFATITVDSVPAAAGGLPAVDLTDGLSTTDKDGQQRTILSDELKALFENMSNGNGNAVGRTPAVAGVDDIEVYYANRLTRPGLNANQSLVAKAFTRQVITNHITGADETKHADTVVMSKAPFSITMAHEIFHILENRVIPRNEADHYPYTGAMAKDEDRVNLMAAGDAQLHEKRPNIPLDAWLWSVRLNKEQEERADTAAQGNDPNKTKLLADPQ